MKNKNFPSFFILVSFLLMIFCLSSCSNASSYSYEKDNKVCVILVENEDFLTVSNDASDDENNPNVAYLEKNNNNQVSFAIKTNENYVPSTCSYRRYRFVKLEDNTFLVQLFRIEYSVRVSLTFKYVEPKENPDDPPTTENIITYDPNGGELINSKRNKVSYNTEYHPRPNTSIGTNIMKRDGYNLIGWNTESDGSGEHIGLGSRYLDVNNSSFTLYASWVKYSDATNFEYKVTNETKGYLAITKYLGNEEIISVPEFIDGKTVTRIEKDAFVNLSMETVILPKSIVSINKGAFNNCAFKELYFYDNIVNIYDESFVDCLNFSTVHINAIEGARFVTADRHAAYADKVDKLILNKDKQKIIILGGSGAYYNVDACLLHDYYPSYEVFNLAINGWFNGPCQMEIISKYMGQGDYLLHVIEMCGKYQFMTDISMGDCDDVMEYDYRYFCCLELNFDLASLVDIRHVTHFFDVFDAFNDVRDKLPVTPYTAYVYFADERGDYLPSDELRTKIIPEDGSKIISEEASIDPESLSEEGAYRLANYYQELMYKGTLVLFAYCPVNKDALPEQDLDERIIFGLTSKVDNYLAPYCRVLNSIVDVLYDFECFSDSDWHLDYAHALMFTEYLAMTIGAL